MKIEKKSKVLKYNKPNTFNVTLIALKITISIFLLTFYFCETFCLPMGDFSMLNDLPEMYSYCKATEDKEMTPVALITDHLVNNDGLFDKHENGDKQKPHSPVQNHHHGITIIAFINYSSFSITPVLAAEVEPLIASINFYFYKI